MNKIKNLPYPKLVILILGATIGLTPLSALSGYLAGLYKVQTFYQTEIPGQYNMPLKAIYYSSAISGSVIDKGLTLKVQTPSSVKEVVYAPNLDAYVGKEFTGNDSANWQKTTAAEIKVGDFVYINGLIDPGTRQLVPISVFIKRS